MNEISSSNLYPTNTTDCYPGKNTLGKMPFYDRWKYWEDQKENIVTYQTNERNPWGSYTVIFYDKTTDAYTMCFPHTGSSMWDIPKETFDSYKDKIIETK